MIHSLRAPDTVISDCNYIYSATKLGNSSVNIAFKRNKVYMYSNDWLSIIYEHYKLKNSHMYNTLSKLYSDNVNKADGHRIVGNSVLVSTSFSSGTVHGYVGILNILAELNTQTKEYDNYIVHENAQQGIKDLINIILKGKNIVFIKPDVKYVFASLTLIPVVHHNFHYITEIEYIKAMVQPMLDKFIFNIAPSQTYENICILKSSTSDNLTLQGVFNKHEITKFSDRLGYKFIEPTDYNEADYARLIYYAKNIVFSWGTTFMKGLLYISENCDTITVLIHKEFKDQYHRVVSSYAKEYKNISIRYILLDTLDTVNL